MKNFVLVALAAALACGVGAVTASAQPLTFQTGNASAGETQTLPPQCKAKQLTTLAKPCSYRWDKAVCAKLAPLVRKMTGLNVIASPKFGAPLYLDCRYRVGDRELALAIGEGGGWTKATFANVVAHSYTVGSSPCNPDQSHVAPMKALQGLGSVASTWDACPAAGYYDDSATPVDPSMASNQHTVEALAVTNRWSVTHVGQFDQLVPMAKLITLVRQLMVLYP